MALPTNSRRGVNKAKAQLRRPINPSAPRQKAPTDPPAHFPPALCFSLSPGVPLPPVLPARRTPSPSVPLRPLSAQRPHMVLHAWRFAQRTGTRGTLRAGWRTGAERAGAPRPPHGASPAPRPCSAPHPRLSSSPLHRSAPRRRCAVAAPAGSRRSAPTRARATVPVRSLPCPLHIWPHRRKATVGQRPAPTSHPVQGHQSGLHKANSPWQIQCLSRDFSVCSLIFFFLSACQSPPCRKASSPATAVSAHSFPVPLGARTWRHRRVS